MSMTPLLRAAPLLALGLSGAPAALAVADHGDSPPAAVAVSAPVASRQREARDLVDRATRVVARIQADPKLRRLLDEVKGIYIVPDIGHAGVGARGTAGMVLSRRNGGWTGPAFFDLGGLSVGDRSRAAAGTVAFLLMTDEAIDNFQEETRFSLDAKGGFTILDSRASMPASLERGDVVFWSDAGKAGAGAAIGLDNIDWDAAINRAYYEQFVTPGMILDGIAVNPQADRLMKALAG